jgi:autotransporter-associated beta strand protein
LSIGANTLTVSPGAFATSGTAGLTFGAVGLTGASTFLVNNNGVVNGLLTLGAINNDVNTVTFDGSGSSTVTGAIGGGANSGGVTKNGTGTLTLTAANTYTGNTMVSNGTLALASSGQVTGTTNVTIAAGATLDVSAIAPWTLGSGQTLSGSGAVNGSVIASGTVAPGISTNGVLRFTNDLTLSGVTVMKINRNNGIASDNITVYGSLTNGGVLTVVTNGAAPLQVNDTFQLFTFTGTPAGAFTATNLPAGYGWDTSQLSVNGTIKVTSGGSRTHPRFTSVTVSGGSVVLSGTNATGSYVLYSSTNMSLPLMNWVPVFTNTFSGNFSITNAQDARQKFYLFQ